MMLHSANAKKACRDVLEKELATAETSFKNPMAKVDTATTLIACSWHGGKV